MPSPNLDYVQLTILAVSGALALWFLYLAVLPTLRSARDSIRSGWKRFRARLDKFWNGLTTKGRFALDIVLSFSFAIALLLPTLLVRELLFAKKLPPDFVLGPLLALAIGLLVAAVVASLPLKKGARKLGVPAWLSVVGAIVAIGFILAPDVGWFRVQYLWLFNRLGYLTDVGIADGGARRVWDDASVTIAIVLGAIAAITAAVTGTNTVVRRLREIRDDSLLDGWQRIVAKKLRDPAASLIIRPITDESQYPLEARIENGSPGRLFPFDSDGKKRARVKLAINEGEVVPHFFDLSTVRDLLTTAHIELETSLFIVTTHSSVEKRDTGVVCYGTGSELMAFSGDEGREFFGGLNNGRSADVRSAVLKARARMLRARPEQRILLCATSHRSSDDLINVLNVMRDEGLDRILLTSATSPLEQGIIGGTEIAAYLQADTTPHP